MAELAAVLGTKVTLQPLPKTDREAVTPPLLRGSAADRRALAEHISKMRISINKPRRCA